jgi:hypothetical protein
MPPLIDDEIQHRDIIMGGWIFKRAAKRMIMLTLEIVCQREASGVMAHRGLLECKNGRR